MSRPTLRAGGVLGRRVSSALSCMGICVVASASQRSWFASSTTRRPVMPPPHESHHLLAVVITPINQVTSSCGQPHCGRYALMPTGLSRNSPSLRSRRGMRRWRDRRSWAGLGKAQLVDQLPDEPPPTPARARQGSAVGRGAWSRIVASIQPPCIPTATLTSWMLQETHRRCVGDGLADGQHHVADNLARDGGRLLQLVRTPPRSPARQVGEPATETSGYRPLPALRPSWPGVSTAREN